MGNILSPTAQKACKAFSRALQEDMELLKAFRDTAAQNFANDYKAVKPTKVYLNKADILGIGKIAANKIIKGLETLGEVEEKAAPAEKKSAAKKKANKKNTKSPATKAAEEEEKE